MDTDMKVIAVTCRETRRGDPMWTLQTAGGDRVNVFNNMLERRPWENSGYALWFLDMHPGQTDRWLNAPIMVPLAQRAIDGSDFPACPLSLLKGSCYK